MLKDGDDYYAKLPISSVPDIKLLNQIKVEPSSVSFSDNDSSLPEEDLQLEHNMNLANAMRLYLLFDDNAPLGSKNIITPFKKNDFGVSFIRYKSQSKLLPVLHSISEC